MWSFVICVNLLHPCSFMLYYYSFWYFCTFVKHYFQVSFNLKVILSMVKITQNTDIAPLRIKSSEIKFG